MTETESKGEGERRCRLRRNIVAISYARPFKFHLNNEEVTVMIHQDDEFFSSPSIERFLSMLSMLGEIEKLTN